MSVVKTAEYIIKIIIDKYCFNRYNAYDTLQLCGSIILHGFMYILGNGIGKEGNVLFSDVLNTFYLW